jgi:hypothetical protein
MGPDADMTRREIAKFSVRYGSRVDVSIAGARSSIGPGRFTRVFLTS